jgi:hypothetical protein
MTKIGVKQIRNNSASQDGYLEDNDFATNTNNSASVAKCGGRGYHHFNGLLLL